MSFSYEYEYPSNDDYTDYDVVSDVFENVTSFSGYLNFFLQFLSVLIGVFHLLVLFQKELRSTSVYILMAGICVSDILNFSIGTYFAGVRWKWFSRVYTLLNLDCFREDYQVFNVAFELLKSIYNATRPISVTLAIVMEFIRTLLLTFPRTNKFFSSPNTVRGLILIVICCWLVYYSWNFVYITSLWFPDNLCDDTERRNKSLNFKEYVYAIPTTVYQAIDNRDRMEHWIRIISTIFYPIITIEMMLKLKEINKHQKHFVHSENHDNLPNLILFMTISFMLSEGVDGIRSMVMLNMYNWREDYMLISKALLSSEYIVRILRCFNTISHPFVCYFMSIHYKNTTKRMLRVKKKIVKVAPLVSVHSSHHGSNEDRTKTN